MGLDPLTWITAVLSLMSDMTLAHDCTSLCLGFLIHKIGPTGLLSACHERTMWAPCLALRSSQSTLAAIRHGCRPPGLACSLSGTQVAGPPAWLLKPSAPSSSENKKTVTLFQD